MGHRRLSPTLRGQVPLLPVLLAGSAVGVGAWAFFSGMTGVMRTVAQGSTGIAAWVVAMVAAVTLVGCGAAVGAASVARAARRR